MKCSWCGAEFVEGLDCDGEPAAGGKKLTAADKRLDLTLRTSLRSLASIMLSSRSDLVWIEELSGRAHMKQINFKAGSTNPCWYQSEAYRKSNLIDFLIVNFFIT